MFLGNRQIFSEVPWYRIHKCSLGEKPAVAESDFFIQIRYIHSH